jgi:hypothetical protein
MWSTSLQLDAEEMNLLEKRSQKLWNTLTWIQRFILHQVAVGDSYLLESMKKILF